jgi:hypothetical protein
VGRNYKHLYIYKSQAPLKSLVVPTTVSTSPIRWLFYPLTEGSVSRRTRLEQLKEKNIWSKLQENRRETNDSAETLLHSLQMSIYLMEYFNWQRCFDLIGKDAV